MKIGLVSPYDWSYPGGVQDHIAHLAAELRSRGNTVRILTPATGLRARRVEYGVYKLGWAAPVRVNGSIARVAVAPDWRGRIRTLLRHEQFDVLHMHEPLASALPLTMLHLSGLTDTVYVGTFHAWARRSLTSTSDWAYYSAKPLLGRYFRRLHGRIAVSPAAAEFVSRFFPGEYRVIPNGVDLQRFSAGVAPLAQYVDGRFNIVFLGRLEQRKGLKYLLRAIPIIRQHYPNTRFLIGGDGPQRVGFQTYVAQAGWRDVVFLGRVAPELLPSLYATADVFCAPNTGGESQGIVLLEAMASGRPVVASDITGFRSVIRNHRDGLLVAPKNHEQLAWAVCHLLEDEEERRRLAVAARERASEFGWEHVADQVLDYYRELRAEYSPVMGRHIARPAAAAVQMLE
ncbi:MAG TPA: glycosyltransferase family 4 protein [Ktedonobacterales bacterium]|nr:glycosyltransferase family 4 protein [Ktedonobacterales bacterium]